MKKKSKSVILKQEMYVSPSFTFDIDYTGMASHGLMVLVDGDRHGDGYVTLIVVNANEILFLPIRRLFVKVNTPLHDFAVTDWSAQQSQGEPLAYFTNNNNGSYITVIVNGT